MEKRKLKSQQQPQAQQKGKSDEEVKKIVNSKEVDNANEPNKQHHVDNHGGFPMHAGAAKVQENILNHPIFYEEDDKNELYYSAVTSLTALKTLKTSKTSKTELEEDGWDNIDENDL